MKVFVVGAGGAIGRRLVPQLTDHGHEVVALTRSEQKRGQIESQGARAVIADALDHDAVMKAVTEAEPEAIIHEATALAGSLDMRKFEQTFEMTNRLRTEGTRNLLDAGEAVSVQKFVAQSFAGWPYARIGGPVKAEDDPLDPDPPAAVRTTMDAIRALESMVTSATWTDGIALRYGGFYGPGTSLSTEADAEQSEMIRKRRFPIVGDGRGRIVDMDQGQDPSAVADDREAPLADHLRLLGLGLGAERGAGA